MAQNGLGYYQIPNGRLQRIQTREMSQAPVLQNWEMRLGPAQQQQVAQNRERRSAQVQQQQIRQLAAVPLAPGPLSPREQIPEPRVPQMRRITIITDLRDLQHRRIFRKPVIDEETWEDFLESCRLRFDNKVHKVLGRNRKEVKLTDKIYEAGYVRKEFSIKIVARLPSDKEAVRQRAFRREQQQAAVAPAAAGAGARPGGAPPDENGYQPMMEDNPFSPGGQSVSSSMATEYEEDPDEAVEKAQFVGNAQCHHGRTFTQMRERLGDALRTNPKKFSRRVFEQPEVYQVLMTWLSRQGR